MAQPTYTPIQLYYSDTLGAAPSNANLLFGELAINIRDGKLYYKDNSGTVQVIATKGAGTIGGSTTQIQYNNAGALAGSSDMTYTSATNTVLLTKLNLTNALGAIYGGTGQSTYTTGDLLYSSAANTLSKLAIGTANYILTVNSGGTNVQWSAPSAISVSTATNLAGGVAGSVPYQSGASTTTFLGIGAADRVMTSSGSAPQWVTALTGLTGVSSSSITNTSLTSGRVVYSSTGGLQTNSANLTFDGTTLTTAGLSNSGTSALVKLVTVGGTSFSGTTVFAPSTPAKLYMGTGTVTDATSAIGATNAVGAITSLAITPIAATNTSVTYTDAATLYIAGAPSAGTNITLTNPFALYVAAGTSYLAGNVGIGTSSPSQPLHVSKNQNASTWAYVSNTTAGTGSAAGFLFASDVVTGAIQAVSSLNTGLGNNNSLWIRTTGAYPITLGTNSTVQMTLDASGNLGIGTTSPSSFARTSIELTNNNGYSASSTVWRSIVVSNASATSGASSGISGVVSGQTVGGIAFVRNGTVNDSGSTVLLYGNGSGYAEGARIDSSGNLGLGVTPSAGWSGGFYAFQIGQTGAFASKAFSAANTQTFIGNNVYYNSAAGNYQYIATGSAAARYALNQATHIWQVAATIGTANTAISFTDAMTLDASGNLMVGATSSSAIANKNIDVNGTGDAAFVLRVGGTTTSYLYSIASQVILGTVGALPITFNPNGTERMRLDASGNLKQVPVTTASGALITSLSATGGTATVNSATYTVSMSASAKLFYVYLASGDAALVFTSYLSSSITFLGITPTSIVASASPSASQFGISKSANSHDIVLKTGSALSSVAASWVMGSLSSVVA